MNKLTQNKGFTIIEVVLVLAIAALIFLMVFIALPTLQANQRDASRKSDASIVSSALTDYTAANRDSVKAGTDEGDVADYVNDLDQYNKDADLLIVAGPSTDTPGAEDEFDVIEIRPGTKCKGTAAESSASRSSTVRIRLENNTPYCIDAS